jgi:hypothetical protein
MTRQPHPVLLNVLTRLYQGDPKLKRLVSLFLHKQKLSAETAEELLMREEFEPAKVEMWHFFNLFASRRNAALATRLIHELYEGRMKPDSALEEFQALIEDESMDPHMPPPPYWNTGVAVPVVSL